MGKVITEWLEQYANSPEFKEAVMNAHDQTKFDVSGFMGQIIAASRQRKLNTAKTVSLECPACGKRFERQSWQLDKRSSNHYCSRECSIRVFVGKGNRKGRPKGPVPEHGRMSRYTNYKCRCDLCRKAASNYNKSRRNEPSKAQLIAIERSGL